MACVPARPCPQTRLGVQRECIPAHERAPPEVADQAVVGDEGVVRLGRLSHRGTPVRRGVHAATLRRTLPAPHHPPRMRPWSGRRRACSAVGRCMIGPVSALEEGREAGQRDGYQRLERSATVGVPALIRALLCLHDRDAEVVRRLCRVLRRASAAAPDALVQEGHLQERPGLPRSVAARTRPLSHRFETRGLP